MAYVMIVALATWVVLFVLIAINAFTGRWLRPWAGFEAIVGGTAALGLLLSLATIANAHPLSPRFTGRATARYWVLFLCLLFAPVALLLLPGEWNQSHAWAILWGAAGIACALVAYFAGRPWPVSR